MKGNVFPIYDKSKYCRLSQQECLPLVLFSCKYKNMEIIIFKYVYKFL